MRLVTSTYCPVAILSPLRLADARHRYISFPVPVLASVRRSKPCVKFTGLDLFCDNTQTGKT